MNFKKNINAIPPNKYPIVSVLVAPICSNKKSTDKVVNSNALKYP